MSEQRVRFEGVAVTADYVTVYFSIGDRLAKRVREVKVPISECLDTELVHWINKAASERLKILWEESQATLPW